MRKGKTYKIQKGALVPRNASVHVERQRKPGLFRLFLSYKAKKLKLLLDNIITITYIIQQ